MDFNMVNVYLIVGILFFITIISCIQIIGFENIKNLMIEENIEFNKINETILYLMLFFLSMVWPLTLLLLLFDDREI
jgi:hypothetical protein